MTAAPPVRTIFIGTGSFAVPALRALAGAREVTLAGIVTAPPRPAGRRGELRPSPVAEAAAEAGLGPVLAPERLRRPDAVAEVLALQPVLVVLADYGQIVPGPLLDLPHGALNLHPSLLPRHRGASPIPATILAGDARTGVTLMRMDTGLDTGPVVAVDPMDLVGDEITPDLEPLLAARGADLLARSLGPWIRGELAALPQGADGATLTRPLRRDDGRLDPARPAAALERQVRALQPWPGSWFEVSSGRFTVWAADVVPLPADPPFADAEAGDIRPFGRVPALVTSDGLLILAALQPAGSRRLSGEEVLRGRPGLLRERVDSPSAALDPGPLERPVGY